MQKSAKSRAEERFFKSRGQQQDKKILKDREKAESDRAAHTARLRALRLAKEAADKEAAATAAPSSGRGQKSPKKPEGAA
ncbi:MAG: hypothetical protein AAB543_06775 [Pseudomonadota bacterium]